MKISTGISAITLNNFQENKIQSEKLYVWPSYNQGKVEKIQGITKKTDSNVVYSKPFPEDKLKIFEMSSQQKEGMYTQSGTSKVQNNILPGSLFDAIV